MADDNSKESLAIKQLHRNSQEAAIKADEKAKELLNSINAQHNDVQRRMNEELRFLTVRDQQRIEQKELISKYFPEYGTQSNFTTGMIGGGSAVLGGIAGLKMPGSMGMKVAMATIGAATGYVAGSGIAEQAYGTETSISGKEHLAQLKRFGPMAAYTARSDWQNSQGSILSPEAFNLDVAMPSGEIARAWNLNEEQFLPGAMDLLSSGLVEAPSAGSGRSFKTVLKEAAGIFKSMQSFFGSVDIAGLSEQIKKMQMAGFTPEGMTELGRSMQNSFLAFAPEDIRRQVQGSVIRSGAQMSAMGLSANVGGQAAVAGYQSAYGNFGGLTGYEKSMFGTQGNLAEAISANMTSVMSNPLLMAGKGDVMAGMRSLTGNIDLTSPEGMRTYRKTMYGLSSTISQSDQIESMDTAVEAYMNMGLDRESAAEAAFGDPRRARAYMIQREGFSKTMDRNIELLSNINVSNNAYVDGDTLAEISGLASSTNATARIKGFQRMGNLGLQGTILRHMARTRAWDSEGVTGSELTESNRAWGLWQSRSWGRLKSSFVGVGDAFQNAVGYKGDNDFQRLGMVAPGEAQRMAREISGTMSAYNAMASGGEADPEVEAALEELASSGGSEIIINRLKEEALTSGRGFSGTSEAANMSRSLGMSKVAKALSDDRLRGQFLQKLEGQNKRFGVGLTSTLYGARSLDATKDMMGSMTADLFKAKNAPSILRSAGEILKNPAVTTGIFATSVIAGAVFGGGLPGAAVGFKFGAYASAGSTALGYALTALADTDENNMSKAQAKRLNQSMYGTNLVVSMIVGSFPENLTSFFKRLAEINSTDKPEACRAAARAIYGTASRVFQSNPEMNEGDFVPRVVEEILGQLSQISVSNPYLAQIYDKYATNKVVLQRVVATIFSYLSGHASPASTETIVSAVGTEIEQISANAVKNSIGDADRKVAAARNLLETNNPGQMKTLQARAMAEETDVKRSTQLLSGIVDATKGTVTNIDGGGNLRDADQAAKFYNVLAKVSKEIRDEEITGVDAQNAKIKQALESEGFRSELGFKDLAGLLSGIQQNLKTSKELSPVVKRIVSDVLNDTDIKEAIRGAFQQINTAPTQ